MRGRCPNCGDWVKTNGNGHCKQCGTAVAQPQVYVVEQGLIYCLYHGRVKPNASGGCPECVSESIIATFTLAEEGV